MAELGTAELVTAETGTAETGMAELGINPSPPPGYATDSHCVIVRLGM